MATIPIKIEYTLRKLKEQEDKPLSLKYIGGHYYVYIATTVKSNDKIINIQKYFGKILDNGQFIQKNGYTKVNDSEYLSFQKLNEIDEIDKKILMALSMNGRATLPLISKLTGMSPTALHYRIKHLEKIYNIKYTIELDLDKLKYHKFLVFMKFIGKNKPSIHEIYKATVNMPNVQFVCSLNGNYDILIYLLAKDNRDVAYAIHIISDSGISNYEIEYYVSTFYETYNFIPLRDVFIDSIKNELKEREYNLIKEFNNNGKMEFTEIDKKYNQDRGRSHYAYFGLKESGLLKRVTINMLDSPVRYIGIIYMSITNVEKFKNRRKLLLLNISKASISIVNNYVLTGDVNIPNGVIFFIPIFNDGDLKTTEDTFKNLKLGTNLNTMVITKNIIGNFCYRLFDNSYSKQHQILIEEYKEPMITQINYDETGRFKKKHIKLDIRGLPLE